MIMAPRVTVATTSDHHGEMKAPLITVFGAASESAAETALETTTSPEGALAEHLLEEGAEGHGCVRNITSLALGGTEESALDSATMSSNATCAYRLLLEAAHEESGNHSAHEKEEALTLPFRLFRLDFAASTHVVAFSSTKNLSSAMTLLDASGSKVAPEHVLHAGVAESYAGHGHGTGHGGHAGHGHTGHGHAHAATADHHDEHDHKPWGEMLLACAIVNFVGLMGVLVIVVSAVCCKDAMTASSQDVFPKEVG
ncbi:unnamed protein product [Amoebophrya sp. A25]|nr:unnamed protein product [Amoebophrya sp. A25]|eukprot:GSA25T00004587001.1